MSMWVVEQVLMDWRIFGLQWINNHDHSSTDLNLEQIDLHGWRMMWGWGVEKDQYWQVSTGSNRCTDMVAHQRTWAMFRNHHHNHLKDLELDLMEYQCMQHQCNMVQCHCNGNNLDRKQKVLMVKLPRLRNVPITLPTLKDVSEPQAALCAGDWLSELMPLISDVSEGARVWWTMVDRTSTTSSGCLHHMADSWSNGSHGCSTWPSGGEQVCQVGVSSAVNAVGCSATDSQARSNLFARDDLRAAGVSHLKAVPTWRSQREKHHPQQLDANNSSQIGSRGWWDAPPNGDVNSCELVNLDYMFQIPCCRWTHSLLNQCAIEPWALAEIFSF